MSDNQEQAEFWNGRIGHGWAEVEDYIDRMLLPLTEVALEKVQPQAGHRIIDIGCGCGGTSLMLAEQGADVWGIDISERMIERANAKGGNARFTVADAAAHDYDPEHDHIFSRFGVMFFANPVGAFDRMRGALKQDGRMTFLCWQYPANNPWIAMVGQALQEYQPADAPPPDPTAPGPFALADPERTGQILRDAGFEDIEIESLERELNLGSINEVLRFQQHVGPLSALLESLDESLHDELIQKVAEVFEPHTSEEGVRLNAAAWLVSAKPGAAT